ncbi:MAG TPA: adenine phosphoribosyltransferase [Propionibacteriaceae bacterium]|nr:adenine phosphoribosyltransferase [Propionibacteriaceae bacterium]
MTGLQIASLISDVPDFPEPGIVFKDITPLIRSSSGFAETIIQLVAAAPDEVDVVIGMEARGFIFGAPVALALGVGFVPVRKPSKLPRATLTASYDLEYGSETLAVHADAITPGARVLIVDDVLATGGTVAATADLVRRLGAQLLGVTVVMELGFLGGREFLARRGITNVTALCVAEA